MPRAISYVADVSYQGATPVATRNALECKLFRNSAGGGNDCNPAAVVRNDPLTPMRYSVHVTPPPSQDGWPDGPSAEGPFLLAIRAGCGGRVHIRAVRQFIHDVVTNLLPGPLRRSGWVDCRHQHCASLQLNAEDTLRQPPRSCSLWMKS
jgi:hypothetical protein